MKSNIKFLQNGPREMPSFVELIAQGDALTLVETCDTDLMRVELSFIGVRLE